MRSIHIKASREYDVLVERGLLDRAGELLREVSAPGMAAIVSDDTVYALYGERTVKALEKAGYRVHSFTFPAGEGSKNLSTYADVLHFLGEHRFSRSDVVVALGGGVVGDLAGFAAATILRGVDFVQVPTTLLAQVDSLYVLASRIVWSMVLTGGILLLRRDRLAGVRAAFRDRREWGLLAAAGCVVCVNWGVYIWAVANGHMIDSSLAYYMNPILAILLGTVLFRERLTKLQWLAVAVTFAGLVITVIRYRQIPWIALVIGGSFAVYGALKKQVRSDAAVSTFVETLTLAPFALVLIFWMEAHGTGAAGVLSGWQWLLLPVSGVVTTVPLMFFAAGMKTTPMTLSGILMYINPTMQLLLSVALYGEAFTATHAILFGFVWTGLILYLISGARENRRHREEEKPCV